VARSRRLNGNPFGGFYQPPARMNSAGPELQPLVLTTALHPEDGKMSLIVCTFHRDPVTDAYIDDPYPEEPGRDLAGFEVWRTNVWGAEAAIRRGAYFLPTLAKSDLYVEHEELDAFEAECQLLLRDIEGFAAEIQEDGAAIRHRLENFLWAIKQARQGNGGVYIG
jgi:hypothetical protein